MAAALMQVEKCVVLIKKAYFEKLKVHQAII